MEKSIDYDSLDVAILVAIANGHREMRDLRSGAVRAEAQKIVKHLNNGTPYWRVVQRRLQMLRAAGRITFTRRSRLNPEGGWIMALEPRAEDAAATSAAANTLGRAAYEVAARTRGLSRRWHHLSAKQQHEWERIASAVVDAYFVSSGPAERPCGPAAAGTARLGSALEVVLQG